MDLNLAQSNDPEEIGEIAGAPDEKEPSYPQVYLNHPDIHKMPDSGHMKVKYRVKGRTSTKHGNKTNHSANVELMHIKVPKKQAPVNGTIADEEAVDNM